MLPLLALLVLLELPTCRMVFQGSLCILTRVWWILPRHLVGRADLWTSMVAARFEDQDNHLDRFDLQVPVC